MLQQTWVAITLEFLLLMIVFKHHYIQIMLLQILLKVITSEVLTCSMLKDIFILDSTLLAQLDLSILILGQMVTPTQPVLDRITWQCFLVALNLCLTLFKHYILIILHCCHIFHIFIMHPGPPGQLLCLALQTCQ